MALPPDDDAALRRLLLQDDPLDLVEGATALGYPPFYGCPSPDPRSIDQAALRLLLSEAPRLASLGIDAAFAAVKADAALADNCLVLQIVDDGADYLYLHYGRNIASAVGLDWTGRRLGRMAAMSGSARIYGPVYQVAAERRAPYYTESANTTAFVAQTWRRLVVPVADAAGRVEGFVVGNVRVPGFSIWTLVTPLGKNDPLTLARHAAARDRVNALSAFEVMREMEATTKGLLGIGRTGIAIAPPTLDAFRYISAAMAEMLGDDRIAAARKKPGELLAPPEVIADIARRLDRGEAQAEIESEISRPDGKRLFARLTFGPIRHNYSPAVAIWMTDLTDHRRLQEDLAAARDATLRAGRDRARLWNSLAHDIRTPVNAVLGFAEAIEVLPGLTLERSREYAGLIGKAGRMMSALIDDLLDAARLEAGKYPIRKLDCDAVPLLAEVAAVLASLAEAKGITLDRALPASHRLRVDPEALKRIAVNLVANAIKFTDRGGTITLALRPGPDRETCVEVADTGRGIAPEAIARILEPFEQAEAAADRAGGAGLGLSIVKGLVELHGGRIDIASDGRSGSVFRVFLPWDGP
ncbi:MAG: PAS domain-containing sensor histidine kinase [Alphaproteobacteria bacterium]|nr:PAS domain-containing sensor histidine kinase [Alphaproteobacteria bacterium]